VPGAPAGVMVTLMVTVCPGPTDAGENGAEGLSDWSQKSPVLLQLLQVSTAV
jgi:hypothetical protein